MLAGPTTAIKVATTRLAARRMPLGGSRPPDGPLGGSRPPSTFGGDYPDGGSPGGDEGCSGSPGDSFPGCGCLAAAAPTAKSSAAAVPIFSAAAIPQAFPAATTSSGARVRLGVDLSEWPPFPAPYAMLPGSCTTYLDHEGP